VRFRAQHTLGVGAAVVALALVGASAWASVNAKTTAKRLRPSAAHPCGVRQRPPRVYAHIVWIVMENRPYGDVIGSPDAPYENRLAARCGIGARYFGITHPSLPNYIAATSGRTYGIGDDDPPSAHPLGGANLFSQIRAAGKTWRAYEEGAPGNCSKESSGTYVPHHNPPTYYTTIRADCARWDVPLGSLNGGNLARALASGSLPAFALVTPDMCHDTHDCSVSDGDRWLAKWFPRILNSRAYRAGTTAVFLLWDEDDEGHDNHIPFIVAAPSVRRGTVVSARLDHYSLLRTTEQVLGIRRALGSAAAARSMRGPFHL
jgi:phosphatidylinositol-3-phosphatase